MMYFGINVCLNGFWICEYYGYFMMDINNNMRFEYICVDVDVIGVKVFFNKR